MIPKKGNKIKHHFAFKTSGESCKIDTIVLSDFSEFTNLDFPVTGVIINSSPLIDFSLSYFFPCLAIVPIISLTE